MKENKAIIFTDGASKGNPGPGGWGSIIVYLDNVVELGGFEKMTTNNRMEIQAAISALSHPILDECSQGVIIYSDSSYLIKGITQWIGGWKRNGWQTKTKDDVSNKDLWMKLDLAVQGKDIQWKYVGGHVGVVGNERCDEIATSFALGADIDLYDGPLEKYFVKNVTDVSQDLELASNKESSRDRSKIKAFSYVSLVGGRIEIHHTWPECEKRVKGVKGARYKKALTKEEEDTIKNQFLSGF